MERTCLVSPNFLIKFGFPFQSRLSKLNAKRTENEIRALITLLSETTPQILSTIKRKLFTLNSSSRLFLEQVLHHDNIKIQKEVSSVLEELLLSDVKRQWVNFTSRNSEPDLEEGNFSLPLFRLSRKVLRIRESLG